MTLKEVVSGLTNYTVSYKNELIAINGNFGKSYSPNEYMNKEVKRTRIIEGLYADYTVISI